MWIYNSDKDAIWNMDNFMDLSVRGFTVVGVSPQGEPCEIKEYESEEAASNELADIVTAIRSGTLVHTLS